MGEKPRQYACIDLKSYYASVECVDRGLDPLTANLVVADESRSDGTICLAVSPSLKALGVPGRPRLFEVKERLAQIKALTGKTVEYITAMPRMARYLEVSSQIYGIYLKYLAAQDIHVYSIDEAFMDLTPYRSFYNMTAHDLVTTMIRDVLRSAGITATGGIGTNLYLAKIAMDITAKHSEGHVGELNEESYKRQLWRHRPLTDFWRIGSGIQRRLAQSGLTTMEEVAHADEGLLYRLFGVDAELLIDHAWGRETTTMEDIKAYRPRSSSVSNGQVLPRDYSFEEGRLAAREMADLLSLELVEKGLVTDSVTLHVGYSGRIERKAAHGTEPMTLTTSSSRQLMACTARLYDRIVDRRTPVRRISVTYNHVVDEAWRQYDLFTDPEELDRELRMQRALLEIKGKYGKNAVVRGMDLQEGATTMERNRQIGGHRSGGETWSRLQKGESENGVQKRAGRDEPPGQSKAVYALRSPEGL